MQYRLVISMIGRLLMVIGLSMLLPLVTAAIHGEADFWVFLVCLPLTTLAGAAMHFLCKTKAKMRAKDGFAVVTYGWLLASLFGSLPYLLSGAVPGFVDAFFETMSGFTTTGSTIINDIEALPPGLLLWRCQTQWLGGLGILVLFVAVLSSTGASGMQIFKAEMPGPFSEKITPRISDNAKILWGIYIIFTAAQIIAFLLCGMTLLDAVCHSFSTAATGGFSTKNASIGHYQSAAIEWVTIVGMFLCSINFALYYHIYHERRLTKLLKNKEVRLYTGILAFSIILISLQLLTIEGLGFHDAVRTATFQIIAIVTTSGFATADYSLWPPLSLMILMMLMITGACAGSTSGGMKIDRVLILLKQTHHELKKFMHPRLVTSLKINSRIIDDGLIVNVGIFVFLYFVITILSTMVITAMGIPVFDALTASITCLSNVGPAMGMFGPAATFAEVPALMKILMSFLMLLGRLEIYTVLVVLIPSKRKR